MIIRCSRCGCVRFFYTLPGSENADKARHHGACCARCGKAINQHDLMPRLPTSVPPPARHAE